MQTTKQNSKLSSLILSIALLFTLGAQAQSLHERQIIVSLQDRKLALVENGEVIRVYPVAVGKGTTPSPSGEFTIVNRLEKPTYYHKGTVIGPGAANPLGTRWMGLSQKGYGIHGTNEPKSIGKAASHGCIRMARKDLEELFTLVEVGDAVEIRDERDEEVARIFGGEPTVITASANVPASQAPATVASTTGQ